LQKWKIILSLHHSRIVQLLCKIESCKHIRSVLYIPLCLYNLYRINFYNSFLACFMFNLNHASSFFSFNFNTESGQPVWQVWASESICQLNRFDFKSFQFEIYFVRKLMKVYFELLPPIISSIGFQLYWKLIVLTFRYLLRNGSYRDLGDYNNGSDLIV